MTAESEAGVDRRVPRLGRVRQIALAIGLVILLVLVALWLQRRPIADRFIQQELAKRGVPARYRIEDIGFRRQRLTDLVIGDPARPDLIADWVEVDTRVGLSGARVTGIRAGKVRLRGRLVNGKLSLGAIDRLMPPPSGKPFALPQLHVEVADARMGLATPWGTAGIRVSGKGRLDDGFAGELLAVAPRLSIDECGVRELRVKGAVRIDEARPTLTGMIGADSLTCGAVEVQSPGATGVELALGEGFDRWRGRAQQVGAQVVGYQGMGTNDPLFDVRFEGGPDRTAGTIEGGTGYFELGSIAGESLGLSGRFEFGRRGSGFAGTLSAERARLAPGAMRAVTGLGGQGRGTPVAPLLDQLARSAAAAAQSMRIEANVSAALGGQGGSVTVERLSASSASGAEAVLSGGEGVHYGWPNGGLKLSGLLSLSGGGLPEGVASLDQAAPGAPVTGTALLKPYAAGGARLALSEVSFSAAPGATRISTRATLSGPVADGQVDGLSLPIDARWNGAARLAVNPACVPAAFERLQVSSLVVERTRLSLCPTGGALAVFDGGRLSGGARVSQPRLTGRIGGTPLTVAASEARFGLADWRFALAGVAARLGSPERITRLDVASLDGRIEGGAVSGSFAGAAGEIGKVPLLLSDAAGGWRFAGGELAVDGGLTVADAAPEPRFLPLVSDDVLLNLAGDRVTATGTLRAPASRTEVAHVALRHDLSGGAGEAMLDVAGIDFAERGFQPSALTRLTLGVIADVQGRVSGQGRIRWTPEGVTSDGVFRTAGTNLAAAFGTANGISAEIRFSDLLGLDSAGSQVVTVAELNPGVPILDGVVRYRLVGEQRVQIEEGRWPFAGGELILEPTLLDFGGGAEKRMTFRVVGADAARFLLEMKFDNLNATGIFDGVLPMIFDEKGGRIEGGRLTARAGGSIAYVGEVTERDLGVWGNLAFQALKALDYRNLDIEMNGPLAGEMVTEIRFAGVSQGEGAKSNFLIRRLQRLPFLFNVTVRAPFRSLVDSVRSYYDPGRLIDRNLPRLIEEQERATGETIQRPESRPVP